MSLLKRILVYVPGELRSTVKAADATVPRNEIDRMDNAIMVPVASVTRPKLQGHKNSADDSKGVTRLKECGTEMDVPLGV